MQPVIKHLPLGGTGNLPVISGNLPEIGTSPIDETSGIAEITRLTNLKTLRLEKPAPFASVISSMILALAIVGLVTVFICFATLTVLVVKFILNL